MFRKFLSLTSSSILKKFNYVLIIAWFCICAIFPIISSFIIFIFYIFIIYQEVSKYKLSKGLLFNRGIHSATIFMLISIFFIYFGYKDYKETGTNEIMKVYYDKK